MFFVGEYNLAVRKKRIELPSRWELEEIKNMTLYYSEFEGIKHFTIGQNQLPPEFYEFANTIDKAEIVLEGNKLVIPDFLYEKLPIKNAVVIGAADVIEIYDKKGYTDYMNNMEPTEELVEMLKDIGL